MRHYSFLTCLLFFAIPFTVKAQLFHRQPPQFIKQSPSIALHIRTPHKADSTHTTYFSLGLIERAAHAHGLGINLLWTRATKDAYGVFVDGLCYNTRNAAGLLVSGIAGISEQTSGVQVSGLANISGGNTNLISLSGLMNLSGSNRHTISIAGLMSIHGTADRSIGLAGLASISSSVQRSISVSGLLNVASETKNALVASGFLNIQGRNSGWSLAPFNIASLNKGLQSGVLNVNMGNGKGVQLGVVNVSASDAQRQVGLFNLKKTSQPSFLLRVGTSSLAEMDFRIKNRFTYSSIGISGWKKELDYRSGLGIAYRYGAFLPLFPRLEVGLEMGYEHNERLTNTQNAIPKRYLALKPALHVEYQFTKQLGIFAAGGYEWLKSYDKFTTLDQRPTAEIGMSFTL